MSRLPRVSGRAAAAPLRRLDSRLSRRGLISAGVLAGVLAVSGVAVAARARGGVLRLGLAGPVPPGPGPGWDTRRAPLAGLAAGGVAETLTEIGPLGELLPGLAAAWERDAAGGDWRLRLTREATFHDGRPLASRDIAASLALHREASPLAPVLAGMAIREDGPDGLRLTLAAPDPSLPFRLADPRLAVWPGGRPEGIGTGLYRAVPGAAGALRLERVASHRRDGAAGFFDAVEAVAFPDPAARAAALLAGEVDAIDPVPGALAEGALAARAGGETWDGLRGLLGAEGEALTLHGPRLGHGAVSGLGPLDGGRIAERWWALA